MGGLAAGLKQKQSTLEPRRYVMKTVICLLMLCCCAASSALGRDSAERLRERLIFCSQFVIEDPGPVNIVDSARDCCRFANSIHDCRLIEREETHR